MKMAPSGPEAQLHLKAENPLEAVQSPVGFLKLTQDCKAMKIETTPKIGGLPLSGCEKIAVCGCFRNAGRCMRVHVAGILL